MKTEMTRLDWYMCFALAGYCASPSFADTNYDDITEHALAQATRAWEAVDEYLDDEQAP